MSASAGDDVPSKQEIEQILYDPQLLKTQAGSDLAWKYLEYVDDEDDPTQYGFKDQAEFEQWRDKVKRDLALSEDPPEDAEDDHDESDVYSAYSHAKDIYDQSQANGRQADKKAADDAKGKLDGMAGRASATNAGANTSDEILDLGQAGMRTFDVFVPLFDRAVAAVGTYQPANKDDLYKLYNEQRKIPFTKFVAGADEFTRLKAAVTDSSNDVKGQLATDLANWQGGAADQAKAFRKNYFADAKTTADGLGHAADAMLAAVGSVGKACRDKANWVIKYRVDALGPVTAQDLDRIIRIVELRGNASQDDFKHCARFLDRESQDLIDDDDCNLDDDTVNHIVDQCTEYLKNNFGKFFDGYVRDFKTMCANTHTAVDGAWKALSDFLLKLPEDPFADVGKPADDGGATKTGGSGPGPGSGPASGPGVGSGGGGVNPPPSAPAGPPPKPPEVPDPSRNPVTHQALESDPGTGPPYPIDPRTGAAIKTGAATPESMTVEQGGHRIVMTGPGPDGRLDIEVGDGSGPGKDYRLGFGPEDRSALNGAPNGTPGDGTGGAGAGGDHHPGPDGKIHVEDGSLEITAERPEGAGGPTVVTVDDGSGDPVKYTLGADPAAAEPISGSTTTGGYDGAATPGSAATSGSAAEVGSAAVPGDPSAPGPVPVDHPGAGGHDPAAPPDAVHPGAATYGHPAAQAVPAGPGPAQVVAAPGDSGPDEATSAQSLLNPLDSHSGLGGPPDDGLGATVDPGGPGGGGASDPAESGLGDAPTPDGQHVESAPMDTMGGGLMGGGLMGGAAGGNGAPEQERSAGPYRVDRGLFGSSGSGGRISGSLDDDSAVGSR